MPVDMQSIRGAQKPPSNLSFRIRLGKRSPPRAPFLQMLQMLGDINFDVNGDRLASYELLVSEPVTDRSNIRLLTWSGQGEGVLLGVSGMVEVW